MWHDGTVPQQGESVEAVTQIAHEAMACLSSPAYSTNGFIKPRTTAGARTVAGIRTAV
jgi:hypothetical protein